MSINNVRISEREAGYLELPGATKDADCQVVDVDGGVSSEKGCCNSFGIKSQDTDSFRCGECKYVEGASDQPKADRPIGKREAATMSESELLDSDRPVDVTPRKGRW